MFLTVHSVNAEYFSDSKNVWYFPQEYVYEIKIKHCNGDLNI